jgi:hypothetical protein
MASQKLKANDYQKIAKEVGLNEMEAKHYTLFMMKRFPNEFYKPYAKEWAMRFKDKRDWMLAYSQSRKVLVEIGHRNKEGRLLS